MFTLNKKINLRESIIQLDKDTDFMYGLTNLYESCKLTEKQQNDLVRYIDAVDIDATNKLLTNASVENGFSMTETVSDDISDEEFSSYVDESFIHMTDETTCNPLVTAQSLKVGDIVYDEETGHRLKILNKIPSGRWQQEIAFGDTETQKTFSQYVGNNSLWELAVEGDTAYEVDDDIDIEFYPVDKLTSKEFESLREDISSSELTQLETDLRAEVSKYMTEVGFEEDEVKDYTAVEIKDTADGDMFQVEVRAELGYEDLMELCNNLNKIVSKLDTHSYFEPVTSGIAHAFIRKDQSDDIVDREVVDNISLRYINNIKTRDDAIKAYDIIKDLSDKKSVTSGTIDALMDRLYAKIDTLEESLHEDFTTIPSTRTVGIYGDEIYGIDSVEELESYLKKKGLTVSNVYGDMEYGWEMDVTGNPRDLFFAIVNTIPGYRCNSVDEFIDKYAIDTPVSIDEDTLNPVIEESVNEPKIATNANGDYLVKASSGKGYTAFNKNDVCIGGTDADTDDEAKNKFMNGKLNEGRFSDDDFEDDRAHSNIYGGDTMYCQDCGTKKKYDEDGFSFCPKCNCETSEECVEESLQTDLKTTYTISKAHEYTMRNAKELESSELVKSVTPVVKYKTEMFELQTTDGRVFYLVPTSMSQFNVYDSNEELVDDRVFYNHIVDEILETSPVNFKYQLVGGEFAGMYTYDELKTLPVFTNEKTPDYSAIRARGGLVHRAELDNQPVLNGYVGPMMNGWSKVKKHTMIIRYETQEVNDMLSH